MERFRLTEMTDRTDRTYYHLEEKVGQRTDDWVVIAHVYDQRHAEYLVRLLNKFQTEVWDPSMFGEPRRE